MTIPRRAYLEKQVPAERAIREAIDAVESLPADTRLTDAVVLLGQAKDKVSDYIDAQLFPAEPDKESREA